MEKKLKVLIADDTTGFGQICANVLKTYGMEVSLCPKDGMAVLKNGTALPVSRSHLQSVREQINRYWGKHV